MCSAESFGIKDVGDLSIHSLLGVQLNDALAQPVRIGMLRVAVHRALQPMLACRARLPDNPDPNVAAPTLLIERNLFDYQSNNLLAVR
jgi:hypothetical protein